MDVFSATPLPARQSARNCWCVLPPVGLVFSSASHCAMARAVTGADGAAKAGTTTQVASTPTNAKAMLRCICVLLVDKRDAALLQQVLHLKTILSGDLGC